VVLFAGDVVLDCGDDAVVLMSVVADGWKSLVVLMGAGRSVDLMAASAVGNFAALMIALIVQFLEVLGWLQG
jgi:ligand-binding sensor protein